MPAKNGPDVVAFLAVFRQLQDLIDDDPEDLATMATDDPTLTALCLKVRNAARPLEFAEDRERELFSAPVDLRFVEAWRRYQDAYISPLAAIDLKDWLGIEISGRPDLTVDKPMAAWHFAAEEATAELLKIRAFVEFGEDRLNLMRDSLDDEIIEDLDDGVRALRRYANTVGPKIKGVLRRRRLVPFVLVPRDISEKHDLETRLSLFSHLQQAQEAFIYGTPFAALALMRSLMEIVLKQHYGATGGKLEVIIDNARNLPQDADQARLHSLRLLANGVLHFNRAQADRLPADENAMEREMAKQLLMLRTLIEGAPGRR